ncbi:hypothetical protein PG997_008603 [Apiospora hydei]|uniref:Uncharacterized protein n=1 Tax=Apiospora hydei TaxID=1337664 RepID=A0ABR1WBA4_9PEZI
MDFFRFPGEVRNMVYRALLVYPDNAILISYERQLSGSIKLTFYDRAFGRRNFLEPAVLRLNKQARLEASPVLYSQNHFDLRNVDEFNMAKDRRCEYMLSFFASIIGRDNAGLIRHVTVQFPHVPEHNGCILSASWLTERSNIPRLLASDYGCVETVEMALGEHGEVQGLGIDNAKEVDQGLALIDTQLRSMPSLKNIVANVFMKDYMHYGLVDFVTASLRDGMVSRGWTLVTKWHFGDAPVPRMARRRRLARVVKTGGLFSRR